MKKSEKKINVPKDPHLDTPSEANTDKHINFLAEEEKDRQFVGGVDIENEQDEKRKKEWQEGIEAGKQKKEDETPFQKRDLNESEEY